MNKFFETRPFGRRRSTPVNLRAGTGKYTTLVKDLAALRQVLPSSLRLSDYRQVDMLPSDYSQLGHAAIGLFSISSMSARHSPSVGS